MINRTLIIIINTPVNYVYRREYMVEYEVSFGGRMVGRYLSFLVCRKHKFMLKKTVYYLWRFQPELQ